VRRFNHSANRASFCCCVSSFSIDWAAAVFPDEFSGCLLGLWRDSRGLVNTVLNARDDSQTIAYIRDWAALKNDARLAQALELALTIPILENSSSCSGGE